MSIYDQLNMKTYINAWGTVTRVGGSIVDPEVISAMNEASKYFIDLEEFHQKTGKRIAELIGVEDAFVSSGAAAGIAISTAACIAGTDIVKINQLPDTTGMPNEVIVMKSHRSRYDQGIRMAGAILKEVGYADLTLPEQLEGAINANTAMCFYLAESESIRGSLPLKIVASIMAKHNIPMLVDAAAELPPRENLRRYLEEGASLVVFSGGKDIRGPQSSGIVLGKSSLIEACRANSCPNHSIGRSMKVDKETLAGLLRAVELYMKKDMHSDMNRMNHIIDYVISSLSQKSMKIEVTRGIPTEPGIQPKICPRAYIRPLGNMTALQLKTLLADGTPAILCGIHEDKIVINSQLLSEEDAKNIVQRISSIMNS